MNENTAAVLSILILVGFLVWLVQIGRKGAIAPEPGDKTIVEIVQDLKAAGSWSERRICFFANIPAMLPILFRKGYWGFVAIVAATGFAALSAIFGFGPQSLEKCRCIALDAYRAILFYLRPDGPTPDPCPLGKPLLP